MVAEVCGVGGADGVVSVLVSVKISHSRFVAEHVAEEGGVVADMGDNLIRIIPH